MENGFEHALALLPPELRSRANALPGAKEAAEEFRLRRARLPTVLFPDGELPLDTRPVSESDIRHVLEIATDASFHAAAEQLRRGFLTARGGVRVGVCGTAVSDGTVHALRDISSLSIRVPRQIRAAGAGILEQLPPSANVLVLSPPGLGKTTLLRELVRRLSDSGVRVGLADERGELAAVYGGVPGFDVGKCTDILTGGAKAETALMLLRAMNPQVIALDEISDPADAAAITAVTGCGVRVFASVHGKNPEDLRSRPVFQKLLEARIFQAAVVIAREQGRRCYRVQAL